MACSSVWRHHHRQVAADREDVGVHLRRDGHGALLELLVVAVDPLGQRAGSGVGETQCAEALLRGHRHRRRPGARDPHRRVRLLQRLGHHVARRHFDVLTLEAGERLLDHAADRNLERFLPHLALVRGIDAEPAELAHRRRLAGAELDPAVGDQVERRHPLGDAGRMVDLRRQVHDPEAEPNVAWCAGWPRTGRSRARSSGSTPRGSGARSATPWRSRPCRRPPPRRDRPGKACVRHRHSTAAAAGIRRTARSSFGYLSM